ncbi:MAG: hypothetical protein H7242_10635 [Microbacteriaceae bacterium]|nr:hypothetical protein [Burkholderiaceae bacterium]
MPPSRGKLRSANCSNNPGAAERLRQALWEASIEAALARFDAAWREAPDPATACVGAAPAWQNPATGWYRDPAVASEHAAEALQRALALDPTQPLAHALPGALQNQFQRD